jgi:hypothetical protein
MFILPCSSFRSVEIGLSLCTELIFLHRNVILPGADMAGRVKNVLHIGFPPKLISSEFRSEFRSISVSTFDEIMGRNYRN